MSEDEQDDARSDDSGEDSETLAKNAAALAAQGRRNWEESFKALETYKKRFGKIHRLLHQCRAW